jgi:hypothetical protein
MSNLSRRSLVAGAATLPALAVPAVAGDTPIPLPAAGDDGRAASVVRAQYIVETLSTRYIREGWHENFDRERAARFIENMRTYELQLHLLQQPRLALGAGRMSVEN